MFNLMSLGLSYRLGQVFTDHDPDNLYERSSQSNPETTTGLTQGPSVHLNESKFERIGLTQGWSGRDPDGLKSELVNPEIKNPH